MTTIDEFVQSEQAAWKVRDSLEFYQTHRTTPDELYESERFFLPRIAASVQSILDVGCAAGGFRPIVRTFNPTVRYVGVDIVPEFIELARRRFPDGEFHVADGLTFPFEPASFDLVHASGVLHLNSRHQEMVQAMWDQSRRYLLCDFRLTRGPSVTGQMALHFGAAASAAAVLPYYVLNVNDLVTFLRSLTPRPIAVSAKGYTHRVSDMAHLSEGEVIMAFFLLEKGPGAECHIDLQLAG